MVESGEMGWNSGENVIVECERSETTTVEQGRRQDFLYRGYQRGSTKIQALNILRGYVPHPLSFASTSKMVVAVGMMIIY